MCRKRQTVNPIKNQRSSMRSIWRRAPGRLFRSDRLTHWIQPARKCREALTDDIHRSLVSSLT